MNTLQSKSLALICLLVMVGQGTSVWGQSPAADPNKAPLVKVVSVKGIAKKIQANDAQSTWTELKADETLDRYAVIRTGLNSRVELDFAQRGMVVVDSGTKVGIAEFTAIGGPNGNVQARIGLKYGSMRLKVDRTRGANDFSVATAVATLSVRGTDGRIAFSADKGLFLYGDEGTFAVVSGPQTRLVSASQRTNGNLDRSRDIKDAERDVQMGDAYVGLTESEKTNLLRYGSGRGVLGFVGNPSAGINPTDTSNRASGHHIP